MYARMQQQYLLRLGRTRIVQPNANPSGNHRDPCATTGTESIPVGGAAPAPTTWWRYVMTVTGNATQKDIAAATGIDQSSISRWQRGANTPRAEAVVTFARAYGRSPVEVWWRRATCPAANWAWWS